jgi:hypothetical protein
VACAEMDKGDRAERDVVQLFANASIVIERNRARDLKKLILWDLKGSLADREFTIEVKYDLMEAKTGNIAVEYYNVRQCKPSGIMATEADLWIFVLQKPRSVWICRTAALLAYFDTAKPHRNIACGGDDNAAMKLYRRKVLFEAVPFHRVDLLSGDDLLSLLNELLG